MATGIVWQHGRVQAMPSVSQAIRRPCDAITVKGLSEGKTTICQSSAKKLKNNFYIFQHSELISCSFAQPRHEVCEDIFRYE